MAECECLFGGRRKRTTRRRRRRRRSPAVDGWHSTLEQTDDVSLDPLPPADCVFGGPFISGSSTSSTKPASQSPTQEPRALSVHPASPSAALSIIIEVSVNDFQIPAGLKRFGGERESETVTWWDVSVLHV